MIQLPNIFNYSTSELTQDAFLTWLLNWANPIYKKENEHLHNLGTSFLESLLALQNIKVDHAITDFEIKQQFHKIDVFISFKMNDCKYGIIIEDKVHTTDHSNQLKRYKNIVTTLIACDVLVPIYFKTGYQVNLQRIKEYGYYHYSIKDFLKIISIDKIELISNDVLSQYYSYLLQKEVHYDDADSQAKSYLINPIKDWTWWTCIGFFHKYKSHFNAGWGEVGNNREPLLAFWFGGKDITVINANNNELKLTLYIDIIYRTKTLNVSYRLSLNNNEQKDAVIRDKIYNTFSPILNKNNIKNKKPKFTKAKKTMLLTQITNLDTNLKHKAFVKEIEKYQKVLNEFVDNNKTIL